VSRLLGEIGTIEWARRTNGILAVASEPGS
jgi:hypothetical protein